MSYTHCCDGFTHRDAQGQQETACGLFVPVEQVAPTGVRPDYWGCAAWLDSLDEAYDDRADHLIPPRRRLSRYEQLEALADAGCDTWAEARGER